LDVAVLGLRREYYTSVGEAAERMTRFNYRGVSPAIARALFQRDLHQQYYERHAGLSEQEDAILEMARVLRSEGWRYLPDRREGRVGGFWRHESGADVNQCGGHFGSFSQATDAAFNSQTRQVVKRIRN
jgi:hypothetical protein